MDKYKKNENVITKKHFAKVNERIQNKYAQMQIRLEKSRSMESISCLGEEFISDRRSAVSEAIDEHSQESSSDKKNVKYSVTVEDINKQDAVLQDNDWTSLYESKVTPGIQDDAYREFFGSEFSLSQDHLHKVSNKASEVIEDQIPLTSPQKVSVRGKLIAARKRIKEERSKKKEEKQVKKKQSEIENADRFILSNKPGIDSYKKKNKVASVIVALIEATEPENETAPDEKPRQLYCRIRLGQEKYKSKAVKVNKNVVSWQEVFNLSLFEDNFLEITVWDKEKDVFVGRTTLDLQDLKQDITHKRHLSLEDGESPLQVFILITISGTIANTVNPSDWERTRNELLEMEKKYSQLMLNDDFAEVGSLKVLVYEAKGLACTECYVSFMLDNDCVQTQADYKTHNPCWMKMFNFEVSDVTSILHVVVHDAKKSEILGQVYIPLLRIINGEKKWYAMKDATARERAKGDNPRILLEMYLFFNVIKSSVRLINPKTIKFLEREQEFKRQVFVKNIDRAKVVFNWLSSTFRIIKTMFEWESRSVNVIALAGWLIFWWFYKSWMLPLLILIPFFWCRPEKYHFISWQPNITWQPLQKMRNEFESSINPKEAKTSLRQKFESLHETVTIVQNTIGFLASLGESVKNLFNFTVPYISFVAILDIIGIFIIMYFIPCNIILMIWGVHKFLRKIFRPDRISNNEVLDLLSRVPDDETVLDCEELPLLPVNDIVEINLNSSQTTISG